MRILLANHTTSVSGAEVSLLRLIEGLRHDHEVAVACPDGGPLADELGTSGIHRFDLPAVDLSLRLHPVQTPRGMLQIAAAGWALARVAQRHRADVIHANTIRTGLLAAAAPRSRVPIVVRAHES